jgi:hypothetical protein
MIHAETRRRGDKRRGYALAEAQRRSGVSLARGEAAFDNMVATALWQQCLRRIHILSVPLRLCERQISFLLRVSASPREQNDGARA